MAVVSTNLSRSPQGIEHTPQYKNEDTQCWYSNTPSCILKGQCSQSEILGKGFFFFFFFNLQFSGIEFFHYKLSTVFLCFMASNRKIGRNNELESIKKPIWKILRDCSHLLYLFLGFMASNRKISRNNGPENIKKQNWKFLGGCSHLLYRYHC